MRFQTVAGKGEGGREKDISENSTNPGLCNRNDRNIQRFLENVLLRTSYAMSAGKC